MSPILHGIEMTDLDKTIRYKNPKEMELPEMESTPALLLPLESLMNERVGGAEETKGEEERWEHLPANAVLPLGLRGVRGLVGRDHRAITYPRPSQFFAILLLL